MEADHFFWVDSRAFPISVPLYTGGVLEKDPAPHLTARQDQAVQVLSSNKAPFWRYPECFLALVGLSLYYPFDMGLLDYIRTADPRKAVVCFGAVLSVARLNVFGEGEGDECPRWFFVSNDQVSVVAADNSLIDARSSRLLRPGADFFLVSLKEMDLTLRWHAAHGMELAMVKCLKSPEYQGILGHALGRAKDYGMQEGLAAGHEHGIAGTPLSAVMAYNP
ncbi:hypothetical protein Tco_0798479 [Tanacetum coccineum]